MLFWLYCFLIFGIAFAICKNMPHYFMLFWIAYKPLVFPVFMRIWPIANYDDLLYYYNRSEFPFFFLFGAMLFTGKRLEVLKKNSLLFVLSFFLISVYFVGRQFPHINTYNIYYLLYLLLAGLFFTQNKRISMSSVSFSRVLEIVVIFQVVFCLLHSLGIFIYPGAAQADDSDLMPGTFTRYNHMANYLTSIFLILSLEFFGSHRYSARKYYLITVVVGVIVLLSGAKMSLAIFCLILMGCMILFANSKKNILSACLFAGFLLLSAIVFFKYSGSQDSSGLARNLDGMTAFLESDIEDGNSTVGLSVYLFLTQFDHPLFGNGIEYQGDYAYTLGECVLRNFQSDAKVAYIIVEYGIVCFILYVLFFRSMFLSIIKGMDKRFVKNTLIIFGYFTILNITELGFFDSTLTPFLFIYTVLSYKKTKDKRMSKPILKAQVEKI